MAALGTAKPRFCGGGGICGTAGPVGALRRLIDGAAAAMAGRGRLGSRFAES